jgi:hypothetical protein
MFQTSSLADILSPTVNATSDADDSWATEMEAELFDSVAPRRTSLQQLDAALASLSSVAAVTFACRSEASATATQVRPPQQPQAAQ